MSDDVKHLEDELDLDTTDQDTEGDDVSTDDAESTEGSDDSSASLNLEEPEAKPDKKAAAKQTQVKGLAAKILTGELTYEAFPEAQKWLLPDVMDTVSMAQGKGSSTPDQSAIDERVNQLFEDRQFKDRLADVKTAGYSPSVNLAIQERYKFLRDKNWSKLEALNDAEMVAKATAPQQKANQPVIRTGGKAPKGSAKQIEDYSIDEINAMTPTQLAKAKGIKVG